jgi:hypothetical protein
MILHLLQIHLKKYYDNIIFGVINDHNSVDNNYKIFKEILG